MQKKNDAVQRFMAVYGNTMSCWDESNIDDDYPVFKQLDEEYEKIMHLKQDEEKKDG